MSLGNFFKKDVGTFFRPRNAFARGARAGSAALGFSLGGPIGAKIGYQMGDKIAGTFENKHPEDSPIKSFFMRGEIPGMSGGGSGNLFSSGSSGIGSGNSDDNLSILKFLSQLRGGGGGMDGSISFGDIGMGTG